MTIGTLSFTERSDSLLSSADLFRETRRTGQSGLRYWRDRELCAKLLDAQEDLRELLRRGLLDLRRYAGLVEQPQAPRLSRRRPLE
jgi:hypothetical protein